MTLDQHLEAANEWGALRKLDLVAPGVIVRWATERLSAERASAPLATLAGLSESARAEEVDEALEDYLVSLGSSIPGLEEAGLIVAKRIARQIVDGTLEPASGARRIWWDVANRVSSLWGSLSEFVGLASEWEDSPDHRAKYEAAIVSAARRLAMSSVPTDAGPQENESD